MSYFRVISCTACECQIKRVEISAEEYNTLYDDFDDDMYSEMEAFTTENNEHYVFNTGGCCKRCEDELYGD